METEINMNNLDEELDETLYVVQWHMGGLSITPEDIGYNVCEQCGDVDVSDSGSDTLGELLLAVAYDFTLGYSFDEDVYVQLKENLSDEGFNLNMSFSEVKSYYDDNFGNLGEK